MSAAPERHELVEGDGDAVPLLASGHAKSLSRWSTSSDAVHIADGADAPTTDLPTPPPSASAKKKKKKKPKKSVKATAASAEGSKEDTNAREARPPVLCISRNKHWKYISSYHGPWLQLPLELLQSLLILNLDPTAISPSEMQPSLPPTNTNGPFYRLKDRMSYSPPDSPSLSSAPPFPTPKPGQAAPPPIDPGVFRSVTMIRQLIDEAAELAVRASCGLSAVALGNMRNNGLSSLSGSTWAAAQSLGINPLGDFGGGNGRNVTMSATRVHRLRVLAVEKLAAAYKADEIASSVMVMQGGSVFDDIAERVLKLEPNHADARYVHFFHEKIPSRQLAESTNTSTLDALIAANPQRLEYYRTRGIVHCFRDEYASAVKDFTQALKESRALRKSRSVHSSFRAPAESRQKGKRKKAKVNGQAPPNGTSAVVDTADGEQVIMHPSTLPDAPDPIEPQLLFHRGAAYLAHAIHLIEESVYRLEGVKKAPPNDITEMRLCYIENGKYGGTEVNNLDGPLGKSDGVKAKAYAEVLADPQFREIVVGLVKKSKRDHERFLTHFDTLGAPDEVSFDLERDGGLEAPVEIIKNAFDILGMLRTLGSSNSNTGSSNRAPSPTPSSLPLPLPLTTYHPLLVESHFSILIAQLLLGDFPSILPTFVRTAHLVVGLEGYPVFLPPRSMAQAEWTETLERLAGGWRAGRMPEVRERDLVISGDMQMRVQEAFGAVTSTGLSRDNERFAEVISGNMTEGSPSSSAPPLSPVSVADDLMYSLASSSAGPSTSASASASIAPSSTPTTHSTHTPSQSGRVSPASDDELTPTTGPDPASRPETEADTSRSDLVTSLQSLRVLLAPVVDKQRQKENALAGTLVPTSAKGKSGKAVVSAKEKERVGDTSYAPRPSKPSINIPLHGPRVEIILAWLAAVYLPDLESVAARQEEV